MTGLVRFLYAATTATSCLADEHTKIIDGVARRDAPRAEKLMLDHLKHIEGSLELDASSEDVDLESIFSS